MSRRQALIFERNAYPEKSIYHSPSAIIPRAKLVRDTKSLTELKAQQELGYYSNVGLPHRDLDKRGPNFGSQIARDRVSFLKE